MRDRHTTPTAVDPDFKRRFKAWRRNLRAAQKSGDTEGAVAQAERMAHRHPDRAEVHREVALHYLAARQVELAIGAWEKAVELDPGDWRTRHQLASALISLGRDEEALAVLGPVARLLPAGSPRFDLAGLYRRAGSDRRALRILRGLVAENPEHRSAWNETIDLLEAMGRCGEAEAARRSRDQAIVPKLSTAEVVERIDAHDPEGGERFVVNIGCRDGRGADPCFDLYQAGYPGLAVDAANWPQVYLNLPSPDVRKLLNTALTPSNVVEVLERAGCPRHPSLIKIDIDSYDGILLESALAAFDPNVIAIEVNPQIPPPLRFSIQYDERYRPSGKFGFFGCSVAFVTDLCRPRGYELLQIDWRDAILVKSEYLGLWDIIPPVDERALFLQDPPRAGGFDELGVDPAAWREEADPQALLSAVWDACVEASIKRSGEVLPFVLTL